MASEPTHPQTETRSATIEANTGPDWESRRKLLLLIGSVLGTVVVFFTALTLLSSTRWFDFAPAAGTISAAPDRVTQVAQFNAGGSRITRVALSPDGTLLATVNAGKPGVTVYRAADNSVLYTLDTGAEVVGCVFSPNSQILVTANSAQQIQVWNVANGQLRYPTLAIQQQPLVALRVTNDGQRLLSASRDGHVAIWQLSDGREMRISSGKLPDLSSGPVTFSEDGSVLAYSNPTSGITIISLDTEEVRDVVDNAAARTTFGGIAFSHSGALIVGWDTTGKVQVFRAATGELVRTLTWSGASDTSATGPIQTGAFSADARLFVVGGRDGSIELWEVESGALRGKVSAQNQPVTALDFSADGRTMVSASDDGSVRSWQAR